MKPTDKFWLQNARGQWFTGGTRGRATWGARRHATILTRAQLGKRPELTGCRLVAAIRDNPAGRVRFVKLSGARVRELDQAAARKLPKGSPLRRHLLHRNPAGSIEWRKVRDPSKLIDAGKWYEYDGQLVTWGSLDGIKAQLYLRRVLRQKKAPYLAVGWGEKKNPRGLGIGPDRQRLALLRTQKMAAHVARLSAVGWDRHQAQLSAERTYPPRVIKDIFGIGPGRRKASLPKTNPGNWRLGRGNPSPAIKRATFEGLQKYTAFVLTPRGRQGPYVDWFANDAAARTGFRAIMKQQGYTVTAVKIGEPCEVTISDKPSKRNPAAAERAARRRGILRYRTQKRGGRLFTCAVVRQRGPRGGRTVCWPRRNPPRKNPGPVRLRVNDPRYTRQLRRTSLGFLARKTSGHVGPVTLMMLNEPRRAGRAIQLLFPEFGPAEHLRAAQLYAQAYNHLTARNRAYLQKHGREPGMRQGKILATQLYERAQMHWHASGRRTPMRISHGPFVAYGILTLPH